uniref:MATH domain-containing protein n=1 Tax=Panagrolaimus davidi TaxID=227884 RepID=A0A914PFQ2_9BILA
MEAEKAINNFFDIQDSKYFTKFIWKIENFSQINSDIGNRVDSCIFCCPNYPDIRFRLGINPNGSSDINKGFLSVYLWIGTSVDIYSRISMELLNNKYESKYIKERQDTVYNNSDQGWGFDQFCHRNIVLDQDNGYLDKDILTIRCKIFIKFYEL